MSWGFSDRYFTFGDLNTSVIDLFIEVGRRQAWQLGLKTNIEKLGTVIVIHLLRRLESKVKGTRA